MTSVHTSSQETFVTAVNSFGSSDSVINVYRYYNEYQPQEISDIETPPLNLRQHLSNTQPLSPQPHVQLSNQVAQLSSQFPSPLQLHVHSPSLHSQSNNLLPQSTNLNTQFSNLHSELPGPLRLHVEQNRPVSQRVSPPAIENIKIEHAQVQDPQTPHPSQAQSQSPEARQAQQVQQPIPLPLPALNWNPRVSSLPTLPLQINRPAPIQTTQKSPQPLPKAQSGLQYARFNHNHTVSISPPPSAIPPLTPTGKTFQHRRAPSNPFEVLYDPTVETASGSPVRKGPLMTSTYHDIENSINTNKFNQTNYPVSHYSQVSAQSSPHRSQIASEAAQFPAPQRTPLFTVIDSPRSLRRSGSVISNSASLRNRNKIKSRNKTVRRSNSIVSHQSNRSATESLFGADSAKEVKKKPFSLRDKIKFIFPVKRRTSLKYANLQQQLPKFSTYDAFMDFISTNYTTQALKQSLPGKMNFFNYNRIIELDPKLDVETAYVDVQNQDGELVINKKSFVGSPVGKKGVSPPFQSAGKYTPITELIYQKYKIAVFANKLWGLPPKFSELYPNDVYLLDKTELNQMNKKLLFEILLRRTVAAKIGYRLQQHGVHEIDSDLMSLTSSGSTASSSNSSSASGSPNINSFTRGITTSKHTRSRAKKSHHSPASSMHESINTEELMKHNVSLYSGLLPSPQISYTSNMFSSIYSDDFKSQLKKLREKHTPEKQAKQVEVIGEPPAHAFSAFAKESDALPPIIPITQLTPDKQNYVNEFNKAYYEKYKQKENVVSSNVYQLKPLQRSEATLSSSDRSISPGLTASPFGFGPGSTEIKDSDVTDMDITQITDAGMDEAEVKASERKNKRHKSGSSSKSNRNSYPGLDISRKSQSTANDSIFQNLDDLSSELSSFLEPEAEQEKEHSSLKIQSQTSLERNVLPDLTQKTASSILLAHEDGVEVIDLKACKAPIKRGKTDIKSLTGSIAGSF